MEEKELFEHYEHKVWEWSPSLYKFFGAATIINLVGLFAIGQFNILSTRGCDTPFVGIVCQAVDSAYIASVFAGKGVDADTRPYEVTEIGDAEVTFIDVSDQLKYPEGYFAETAENNGNLSNGDEISQSFGSNGSLPTTPSLGNEKDLGIQVLPTPNDTVGKQETVDEPFKIGGDEKKPSKSNFPTVKRTPTKPTKIKTPPNQSPGKLPGDDEIAGNKPVKPTPSPTPTPNADGAKQEFNDKFNRKPLQDFADGVIAQIDSQKPESKVDLKQNFTVVLDGTLTAEGKFDAKATRFTKGEGNEQMVNVAKDAIEAMGDSNLFSYLKALGVDKMNITLVQDDKKIFAVIASNLPSPEKARTIYSGFNGIIALANMNTKDDKEVQTLLKATKFKAEGKNFVINFEMAKDQAHQMIEQKLGEARQKKLQNSNDDGAKEATAKGR